MYLVCFGAATATASFSFTVDILTLLSCRSHIDGRECLVSLSANACSLPTGDLQISR